MVLRGWLAVGGIACLQWASAVSAAECLINSSDLSQLKGVSERRQVFPEGMIRLEECRGSRVTGGSAKDATSLWVWYLDAADGRSKRLALAPGQSLEQAFSGIQTGNIAPPGGLIERLWAIARANPGMRPGFSRFDPRDGLPLAGRVLPGRVLRLRLSVIGWQAHEPVLMSIGTAPSVMLVPVQGEILLDLRTASSGPLVLRQGRLTAELEIDEPATANEVAAVLQELRRDEATFGDQRWRRVLYLVENNHELDAIHEHLAP